MIEVFVETGKKKNFVGAIEWPGWCRWGRSENDAIDSFLEYGKRYAKIIEHSEFKIEILPNRENIKIVERQAGDITTDFGAPSMIYNFDKSPMLSEEYRKSESILIASWQKFDEVADSAKGKELKKGPRGGGRELEKIIKHVQSADQQYLRRMAWKYNIIEENNTQEELERIRSGILGALENAENGELPEQGPRGGKIWLPRFFIRRVVWHTLDHAWEIEDRIVDE